MFKFRHLIAAVLTTVHIHFALSFQPGSDYDVPNTSNLYNCTGENPSSSVTVSNAFDTLPQIDPSSGQGWEQWSLYVYGALPVILRWNQGNPSGSEASPAHFDILIGFNGSTIQTTVEGSLSYTSSGNANQISVAGNSLTWDSDSLWYNVSVSGDGYDLTLNSFSATLDAFHPNVDSYNGLLDESGSWFGSVPLIRGHVDIGILNTLTDGEVTVDGLTVIRHMFSENPLPSYITQYSGGTIWGYTAVYYDSHIFYQTETTSGTVHEAAFIGRALPTVDQLGGFSSAWAIYAVTDDPLYSLSINAASNKINASFSGCSNTDNIPYQFNVNSLMQIGEFIDAGGGITTYYNINGTTTAPFYDVAVNGTISGIFEEYQAPT